MNRWEYKEERGLHKDCKTPQLPDTDLKKYLLSSGTAVKGEDIVVTTNSNKKQDDKKKKKKEEVKKTKVVKKVLVIKDQPQVRVQPKRKSSETTLHASPKKKQKDNNDDEKIHVDVADSAQIIQSEEQENNVSVNDLLQQLICKSKSSFQINQNSVVTSAPKESKLYPIETANDTSESKVINTSVSGQKSGISEANIRAQLEFQHMQMRLDMQRYQYEMEIREQKI